MASPHGLVTADQRPTPELQRLVTVEMADSRSNPCEIQEMTLWRLSQRPDDSPFIHLMGLHAVIPKRQHRPSSFRTMNAPTVGRLTASEGSRT
jgi:hypothetical protein